MTDAVKVVTEEQRHVIAAGVVQLSKRKENQAKECFKVGEHAAGTIVMQNQKALDSGWADAIAALEHGEATAQQLEWLRDASAIIVNNARAAAGTLTALGADWVDTAQKLKETADRLGREFGALIPGAPPKNEDPRQQKLKLEGGGKKGRARGKDAAAGEGAGRRDDDQDPPEMSIGGAGTVKGHLPAESDDEVIDAPPPKVGREGAAALQMAAKIGEGEATATGIAGS